MYVRAITPRRVRQQAAGLIDIYPEFVSMKRSQTPPILALTLGAFYFFLAGLPRLFNEGRPYLKFMKHVDLDLPLLWLFWGAEVLGLYRPVFSTGWDPSISRKLQGVALGTFLYMAMGYVLGIVIARRTSR
jgi:hypothetical protein